MFLVQLILRSQAISAQRSLHTHKHLYSRAAFQGGSPRSVPRHRGIRAPRPPAQEHRRPPALQVSSLKAPGLKPKISSPRAPAQEHRRPPGAATYTLQQRRVPGDRPEMACNLHYR
jgi:hypothetical protein